MGINTDYFVASSDELAASLLEGGPSESSAEVPMVETKGLDPTVVMGTLESLLTGRDYDAVVENPRQGLDVASDDDGVWVIALTDELRDALAAADEGRLRIVGAELALTEEIDARDADDVAALVDVLTGLASLARIARERGEGMYCWMCL
jgi:hypothetical protein